MHIHAHARTIAVADDIALGVNLQAREGKGSKRGATVAVRRLSSLAKIRIAYFEAPP